MPAGAADKNALPLLDLPSHGIRVALRHDGIVFATPKGVVGEGCTGSRGITVPRAAVDAPDFGAVSRCARTLNSARPDDSLAEVTADPDVRFGELMKLISAIRSDEAGELFSALHFGPPPGVNAVAVACSNLPPSSASHPTPLPAPILTGKPLESNAVLLRISKTQIVVGDDAVGVVVYPDLDDVAHAGAPAKYKRSESDLYLVPLGDALAKFRLLDRNANDASGTPTATSDMIIVADERLSYRLFYEVLFTAQQCEFGKYQLLAMKKSP
jgi:biopolymer transport protein ExbD